MVMVIIDGGCHLNELPRSLLSCANFMSLISSVMMFSDKSTNGKPFQLISARLIIYPRNYEERQHFPQTLPSIRPFNYATNLHERLGLIDVVSLSRPLTSHWSECWCHLSVQLTRWTRIKSTIHLGVHSSNDETGGVSSAAVARVNFTSLLSVRSSYIATTTTISRAKTIEC